MAYRRTNHGWTVARNLLILALLVRAASPLSAFEDGDLYKAVAFVTGTEEPERTRGFRDGLELAVIKLTGNAELNDSPRLAPYLAKVHGLVASFEYEDRMKGIPVHDEQGTRERPHFLRVTFDMAKLDTLLSELGLRKWPAPRPRLGVLLAVREPRGDYVLTATGQRGYGQREVLKSISGKRAVPVMLPAEGADITVDNIVSANRARLAAAARALQADSLLSGALSLDDQGIYWNMRWTLLDKGKTQSWTLQGVTFDKAINGGVERAARILSGRAARK